MDRSEALAICFANLKGSKHKDLLETARALQYLKALPVYRSNSKLGSAVGVSGEMVRQFLSLLELPPEIQSMIDQRELNLEQSRRLWQLSHHRPESLLAAAEAIKNLSAIDSRHVVTYIIRHPELSIVEARNQVIESKTVTRQEFHVIALLSGDEYRLLKIAAQKKGITPDVLVTSLVKGWLQTDEQDD